MYDTIYTNIFFMEEFFQKVLTNRYWFIGFVTFLIIVILFMWNVINPTSFQVAICRFINIMFIFFKYLLMLGIVIFALRFMFMGNKGGGKH